MSVMNSEKLNIQTTWNMEMPNEVMLKLRKQVPAVTRLMSDYVKVLGAFCKQAREQGKVMYKRAVENIAAVTPPECIIAVTDKTILILKEYKKKVELVLDAAVKFLRETKFQVPGYEKRLSGLEIYQQFSAFVADVSEEAVEKIPQYVASMFNGVLDFFQTIEFTIPGSKHVISGKEILDDLIIALGKMQQQVIVTVRKLRNIQMEDITRKYSAFIQFTIEQSEKLCQTLKSQNVEKLSTFVIDVYNDFMSSPILADVSKQVEEACRIVMEYLKSVRAKIQSVWAEMSNEQLQADIQSWIDSMMKRVNAFHNTVIRTLKEKSKNVKQCVKVSDRQIEVDIPLPFAARFN